MIYFCCDELRRNAVDAHSTLNGIDYLEVLDRDVPAGSPRQQTLLVRCLKAIPALTRDNVRIDGGERITPVKAPWAYCANVIPAELLTPEEQSYFTSLPQADHVLVVRTDSSGDYSTYRLSLVKSPTAHAPPDPFDPMLSAVDFSFKVECPSDFDCKPQRVCLPEPLPEPEINYLAKDYASFLRLMLDRMALLMSQWKERNTADLGIALVELLAYVGDHLSYRQDAIATEAYLDTARSRISVRRHARLVDYFMHDGCNARVWVQVQVNADNSVVLEKGTQMFTRVTGQPVCISPNSQAYDQALKQRPEVFETMHNATLFKEHNELHFYTWGDQRCCLPKGATRATLKDHYPNLKAGDVLIFEEILGPLTGKPEDADPTRRHAVRLTHVTLSQDLAGGRFLEPPNNDPVNVTEIVWATEDALPFPLCISSKKADDISIAYGNVVLADHGRTIPGGLKPEHVPEAKIIKVPTTGNDRCEELKPVQIPTRFRPRLNEKPLTYAVPYCEKFVFDIDFKQQYQVDLDNRQLPEDLKRLFTSREITFLAAFSIQGSNSEWSISDGKQAYIIRKEISRLKVYKLYNSAHTAMYFSPRMALPKIIKLESKLNGDTATWEPKRDLLNSGPDKEEFIVEIENDGTAFLRFGDDKYGKRPEPKTEFTATYRVGNGVAGNVGAEAIAHIVSNEAIISIRNPLSAQGGREPETIEEVRKKAPFAFRTQERAVTEEDYAEVAERHSSVQQAAATFRWTGSWHTVFLTIDRKGGLPVDDTFEKEIRQYVERYRMAGYDLEVEGPRFVSLEIEMDVCVKPDYFRSEVKRALIEVFSNQILPDGRQGVFHPDNFTFGQTVYLSRLYAAAQAVPGVSSAHITKFIRQDIPDDPKPLEENKLTLGRLEIARLDNDPNFPEHGVFRLNIKGGK
jgi:hypothetical protein